MNEKNQEFHGSNKKEEVKGEEGFFEELVIFSERDPRVSVITQNEKKCCFFV